MFETFEGLDNLVSNAYWEANLPSNYNKPAESTSSYNVEMFLREKYERKHWIGSGPDPVTLALAPKPKEHQRLENRTQVNETPVVPHKAALPRPQNSGPQSANLQSSPFNPFPQNNLSNNLSNNLLNNSSNNLLNNSLNNPPPQFMQAPIHQNSGFGQNMNPNMGLNGNLSVNPNYNPSINSNLNPGGNQGYSAPQYPNNQSLGFNGGNGQGNGPASFSPSGYPPQNPQGYADAEKNMKINQVLSMYAPQHSQPAPQVSTGFKPLGAIAAQNFFSQSTRPQYPTF